MAMPPKARGRRSRLLRAGETPDDRLLVIRATPADSDGAADEMVEDAVLSARQYVIEARPGVREVLYGLSVFARRPGVDISVVVERFTGAAAYLEVAVEALRAVGFEIHPTGKNPDHFDVLNRSRNPSARLATSRRARRLRLTLGASGVK